MAYDEPIEEDENLIKKVLKNKKPKFSAMERMLNSELDEIYSFDENGEVIMDEKTGKPYLDPDKIKKQEITKMYQLHTIYQEKSVRKQLYKGFLKDLKRRLRKGKITEQEFETEKERSRYLFATGYFKGYEGQDIKQLYADVVERKA